MARERKLQIAASLSVLERNGTEVAPHTANVLGHNLIVLPGVFSPKYYPSTAFYTSALPIDDNDRVLEVGAGCGATSVIAALRGAAVVHAVDISASAIECVRLNALLHHVDHIVVPYVSDIFDAITEEGFDIIYWSLPFIFRTEDYCLNTELERAIFDPGYRLASRFLKGATKLLSEKGRIFCGFGDFGERDLLDAVADECHLRIVNHATILATEGAPVEFQLLEMVRVRA